MRKKILVAVFALLIISLTTVALANVGIKMLVNGQTVSTDVDPLMQDNRVMVPIRFVAEALGCDVQWDEENNAVIITKSTGDKYLKGQNDASLQEPSIHTNFVKAADLLAVLDDDQDGDVCDYRDGHNNGDDISNDPLVVDVRNLVDYEAGHVPGAIWISTAQEAAQPENIAKLKAALQEHINNGGKNEIVMYCYTAHTAGLAVGVLGSEGLNIKNMRFGYSIAWEGTRQPDATIFGPREDKDGNAVPYSEE